MEWRRVVLVLSLLSISFAGQSFFNILDTETGDFGGLSFPERSRFETFIETDSVGDVTSYGLYMPKLSQMGLNFTVPTAGPRRGAAIDFKKSVLKEPTQVPFEFIGVNYSPIGHNGKEYLIPHFDLHVWLYPNEFARGIECNGTTFPPCQTTQWQAARFGNVAPLEYFPPGTHTNSGEWVPTMGAHVVQIDPDDDFETRPGILVGSYLGKVIYYEPMISSKIFLDTETNGPVDFPWPTLKLPTNGRYYRNIRVEYDPVSERYKISFNQLVVAPEEHRGRPVYVGSQLLNLSPLSFTSNVSGSKNCIINSGSIVDGGYMIESNGLSICCRARGKYDPIFNSCENNVCGTQTPLVTPPSSFIYNSNTNTCYARCVQRV